MKSYEIDIQLRSYFDRVGIGYEEDAEHTTIDRTQTDQGRGGVVLKITGATAGQLWSAIRALLNNQIDDRDIDSDEQVNFNLDSNGFWLLWYYYRNPTGGFDTSWAEIVEFTCEIDSPSGSEGKSHGADDLLRERVSEYFEGWREWPSFANARIKSGTVYIGPR